MSRRCGGGIHHGFGFAPGVALGAVVGLGLTAPYYAEPYYWRGDAYPYCGYCPYDAGYPYGAYPYYAGYTAYQAGYADECYLVRRHVLTRYGWRWRSVQICN